jgi:hypothetical protein
MSHWNSGCNTKKEEYYKSVYVYALMYSADNHLDYDIEKYVNAIAFFWNDNDGKPQGFDKLNEPTIKELSFFLSMLNKYQKYKRPEILTYYRSRAELM